MVAGVIGHVEIGLSNINEIDDVMDLIQQAFDSQSEREKPFYSSVDEKSRFLPLFGMTS